MSLTEAILLFLAGFLSGAVNAVAGGGTFITFGGLTLAGAPAIVANATSSVTQIPGYITSTLAYWSDIRTMWRGALLLCVISAVGALAGALILLALDNPSFRALVPWLLIGSTALFAAGPWLKPKPRTGGERAAGTLAKSSVRTTRSRGRMGSTHSASSRSPSPADFPPGCTARATWAAAAGARAASPPPPCAWPAGPSGGRSVQRPSRSQ